VKVGIATDAGAIVSMAFLASVVSKQGSVRH
jgi:hypothetical protein